MSRKTREEQEKKALSWYRDLDCKDDEYVAIATCFNCDSILNLAVKKGTQFHRNPFRCACCGIWLEAVEEFVGGGRKTMPPMHDPEYDWE